MRWMPVRGFEGLYEVSENGDVLSVARTVQNKGHSMKVKGTVLKQSTNDWGYQIVNLYKDGKQHCRQIHRLVAESFIHPFSGEQVNHIERISLRALQGV